MDFKAIQERYGFQWWMFPPFQAEFIELEEYAEFGADNTSKPLCKIADEEGHMFIVVRAGVESFGRTSNPPELWAGTHTVKLPPYYFLGRINWLPVIDDNQPEDLLMSPTKYNDANIFQHTPAVPNLTKAGFGELSVVRFDESRFRLFCMPGKTLAIKVNFGDTNAGGTPPPDDTELFVKASLSAYKLDIRKLGEYHDPAQYTTGNS